MVTKIDVGLSVGSGPPMRRARAMARAGRLLGFDSLWVVDHLTGWIPSEVWDTDFTWLARRHRAPNAYFDWTVLAGGLARAAGRLPVAVGVTDTLRRHPVVLAQAALTLSHLAKAPPILGVGAGEAENVVPYGVSFERPVARLESALTVIRAALDGSGPLPAGEHHPIEDGALVLGPGQAGTPRLWIGAHGPKMLELTGRYGDGWYPAFPLSPESYRSSLDAVRDAARSAGRDPESVVPSMQAFIVGARTEAAAARALRHPAIRFMALLTPDSMWKRHGLTHPLGEGHAGMIRFIPERHRRAEIWRAIEAVPPELLEREVIWGSTDRIVEQIRRLGAAGLRHVVFAPLSPLVSRSMMFESLAMLPALVRRLRTGS